MDKELVGASTGMLVMGILARRATYGYDIVRQANVEAGGLFEWREGTIYPILHKLEKQELVRAQWRDSESGRRRKYYQLTATGRRVLEKRAASWRQVNALLLKVVEDGRAT